MRAPHPRASRRRARRILNDATGETERAPRSSTAAYRTTSTRTFPGAEARREASSRPSSPRRRRSAGPSWTRTARRRRCDRARRKTRRRARRRRARRRAFPPKPPPRRRAISPKPRRGGGRFRRKRAARHDPPRVRTPHAEHDPSAPWRAPVALVIAHYDEWDDLDEMPVWANNSKDPRVHPDAPTARGYTVGADVPASAPRVARLRAQPRVRGRRVPAVRAGPLRQPPGRRRVRAGGRGQDRRRAFAARQSRDAPKGARRRRVPPDQRRLGWKLRAGVLPQARPVPGVVVGDVAADVDKCWRTVAGWWGHEGRPRRCPPPGYCCNYSRRRAKASARRRWRRGAKAYEALIERGERSPGAGPVATRTDDKWQIAIALEHMAHVMFGGHFPHYPRHCGEARVGASNENENENENAFLDAPVMGTFPDACCGGDACGAKGPFYAEDTDWTAGEPDFESGAPLAAREPPDLGKGRTRAPGPGWATPRRRATTRWSASPPGRDVSELDARRRARGSSSSERRWRRRGKTSPSWATTTARGASPSRRAPTVKGRVTRARRGVTAGGARRRAAAAEFERRSRRMT